jgi:hypothetical protein
MCLLGAVAAIAMLGITDIPAQAAQPQPQAPISAQEREALIAAKAAARRAAGMPDPPSIVTAVPGDPIQARQETITVPAALRRQGIQDQLNADVAARDALLRERPDLAMQINAHYGARIAEYQEKFGAPIRYLTFQAAVTHAGRRSIYWTSFTYVADFSAISDPTNLMFYGVGGGWEVEYDLRFWTRGDDNHRWEDAAGGGCTTDYQWEGLKNDDPAPWWWARAPLVAPDGSGFYRNLQVVADTCSFDSRHHLRLFGTPVHDSEYGNWAIGAAHFEDWNWPCCGHTVASWDDGDWRVQQSFRAWDNGPLLWFVGAIYYAYFGNQGTWQSVFTDGWGTVLYLTS